MNKIFSIVALLTIYLTTLTAAPVSQTATADATLKTIMTLTKNNDLSFGVIYVDGSTSGNITLTPAGTISSTNNIPLGSGSRVADFTVSGDAGVSVNLTVVGTPLSAGGYNLTVDYLLDQTTVVLDSISGTANVKVGGTLVIPINVEIGLYTGSLTITADY